MNRKTEKKKPGLLWFFFWGRKRRGFPGLLVGLIAGILALALLYSLPQGVAISRLLFWLPFFILALLTLVALLVALYGLVRRPPGRR
ncbi:MAG: hypothetical protein ACREP9_07115 [Candidatus Dormibacteraceae bacterium]